MSTGSSGAVEQVIEGIHSIHGSAAAGNIHAKHRAIKACAEAAVRFGQMASMLSRVLAEPGSNYGPEITEPLGKAGTHLQATALAFGESDAALSSLKGMTVGELADSPRQAPDKSELTETGS